MISLKIIREKIDPVEVKKMLPERLIENEEVQQKVISIIKRVREEGDKALLEMTAEFDGAQLTLDELKVKPVEIELACKSVDKEFLDAIRLARKRITAYHERQTAKGWTLTDGQTELGQLVRPVGRAGVYVPGGRAAYPSSVLMNAVPARVAGVPEIAMCVPPASDGTVNPFTLAAAAEAGITEIYRVGGAHAIAALAHGTETVKKVDKITGPGNIYVTLAKKMVVGMVDIDMLAGPSEIAIVADETADPRFIAADMLAQAEHDPQAMAVLISLSAEMAQEAVAELDRQLQCLSQPETARISLERNGRVFVVRNINEAIEIVNLIAPEHLELMIREPRSVIDQVKNAGAIFLGLYSPEAVGDYLAGPNHILPTSGTARFCSPLSVDDFVKRTSLIFFSEEDLKELIPAVKVMAEAEKLEAHARAVLIRKEESE